MCESNALRKVYFMFERISRTRPLGGIAGCNNLHVTEMTPRPNLKVVMMMSTCDCRPPPSPLLPIIPATGDDTESEEREGPGCYTD